MFGRSNKRESGFILNDGAVIASTQQCVHCGNHQVIIPGSGKRRGWCTLCQGFLCGEFFCMDNCVPFEARLEYQEAKAVQDMKHVAKLASRYPAIKQLIF